jgi:hypothetical protein
VATALSSAAIKENGTANIDKNKNQVLNLSLVNLSKTFYDTISGLLPKLESDEKYREIVNAYKKAIFEKSNEKLFKKSN